ncbi:MAG: J domain-containing protein [Photobacterium aquimaris]|nr:J domain-containing protein [Photobacterium aquimaris]
MTTFHELLGTNDNCSKADIKKKYRQLSVSLHPDKGGSQVLMKMLNLAYQQVIQGNGNQKCAEIPFGSDDNADVPQQNTAVLKEKIRTLIKEKAHLQALIEQNQQQLTHAYNAGENCAREALVLLQTTNSRLNEQLLVLQRQIDSDTTSAHGANKGVKSLYIVIIASLIIIVALIVWFIWHYKTQHLQPQSLPSIPVTTPVSVVSVTPSQSTVIEHTETENNVERIMLTDTVGLWQQRYYEGTRQPYIAVRSANGSYIVKDCQGTFSYYSHHSARVAANLIYSTNDHQFAVYRIPYGNGSTDQQWLNSKSVSINNNIFSNNGYKSSSLALASVCRNSVPF